MILQGTEAQGLTLGEAARRFATSELCPQIVGSPETVADQLQDLFEAHACDGFILTPTLMPGMFEQFVRAVVPVLQARGLFRRDYAGTTLREHLRGCETRRRMEIAVTGGLGRLGRYVVRELTQHTVRVLDIGAQADCHPVDLRDLDALRAGLRGVEVVVHLGGIDRSVATDDAATMQVNAMGTWNLFEASLQIGVRRVIHCSSSSVLGLDHSNPHMPPSYLPIDEAHPPRPTDAYGLSKLCGERIAEAYSRRGMEVIVIRPCFVAFPDMADFMAGKPGPEGRSEPMPYLRTYVGPEDCARGFAAAATVEYAGFETFFLAADDAFATEPTVGEAGSAVRDARSRCAMRRCIGSIPRASPISNAAAQPAPRLDADDTLDGRRDHRLTVPRSHGGTHHEPDQSGRPGDRRRPGHRQGLGARAGRGRRACRRRRHRPAEGRGDGGRHHVAAAPGACRAGRCRRSAAHRPHGARGAASSSARSTSC